MGAFVTGTVKISLTYQLSVLLEQRDTRIPILRGYSDGDGSDGDGDDDGGVDSDDGSGDRGGGDDG